MKRTMCLAISCLLLAATPAWADAPSFTLAYGGPAAEEDFKRYKARIESLILEAETTLKSRNFAQGFVQAKAADRVFNDYNTNPAIANNDAWKAYVADGSVAKRITELYAFAKLAEGGSMLKKSFLRMREFYGKHLSALKANAPAEAIGQLGFLEHEGEGLLKRYEALKKDGIDLTTITYVVDGKDLSGPAVMAEIDKMMGEAANRANLHAKAQARWKAALKGDRLKVYQDQGMPEWDARNVDGFDPAGAAKAPKWIYSMGPYYSLQMGRYRIIREYHFSGNKLVNQTKENRPY